MIEAVVDTGILIDYLRGFGPAGDFISSARSSGLTCYISVLTEAELFAGRDGNDQAKRELLAELISRFRAVEVDSSIARKAGDIARKYGTLMSDAIIAATAESMDCRLFTKNLKDFKQITEIKVEEPY